MATKFYFPPITYILFFSLNEQAHANDLGLNKLQIGFHSGNFTYLNFYFETAS